MPRTFLNQYKDGDAVDEVFLLAEKNLRANRHANMYLLATLRDKTGTMSGLQWNVTEDQLAHLNSGDFVHIRGKVQLFQGALQVIITHLWAVPPEQVDPEDFHLQASGDTPAQIDRMRELLSSVTDIDLRNLFEEFFADEEFVDALAQAPAGVKAHHAYRGGLVEHVLNIMEMADRVSGLFPGLNRDLLLAGVFLHDLGKTREMAFEASFIYTDEGQLLGHMLIGCEMLTSKISAVEYRTGREFPEPLAWHLKHLILSHHGTAEFGSSKLPMTPEAVTLHHLDALDAKVHEFLRMIEDDPNADSHWTPFSPRLQRKIFKGVRQSPSQLPD